MYAIVRASIGPYVRETWGTWDEADQRRRFDAVTRPEEHDILEVDGVPIGCICVKWSDTEVDLVRLFILPQFQNRGHGTAILREILAAADARGLPVCLRVLRVNPARRLYERHGFAVCGESDTHYSMARPARRAAAADEVRG